MRPEPEVREALAIIAYFIAKASPGPDLDSLEHAAFALRWVLGLKSPMADIVRDLGDRAALPPAPRHR